MKSQIAIRFLVSLHLLALLFGFGPRVLAEGGAAGSAFFENHIRPQLVEHCYECHSAAAKKLKGGLRLDTRAGLMAGGDSGPAIVPGDPDRSLLIKAVRHTGKDLAMPRGTNGSRKLPDHVVADLARWVQMGAPYPEPTALATHEPKTHWAFQPIQNPPLPPVRRSAWPRSSIDRFILAKLESQGLQPAAPADPRTLLRRVTFDLTGLPPTPEEIDAFRADPSPDAFARVVDRLLDSPRYGERWGRHWLDVVRYADTAGDTADYPVPDAWRYRNYVIDVFNNDKPYDEFIREQIAGDILARQGPRERYPERVTATGYLAISRRFGFDSENYHHLTIQDTIDTLGQSVLGLSLGCARCHNHKYDPIPATDYYALYGIFESTRYAFPGSEQKAKYRALVPLLPREESEARWRGFEDRFTALGLKPAAVLRSLDDMDGDFEMQRVASGGSKGVLVPPWNYDGVVAVTAEAQSPFKNVHPFGTVGASVPAGTNAYHIGQTLYPRRTPERDHLLHVSFDFRLASHQPPPPGRHRFWIGTQSSAPAVEVFISADAISLGQGDRQVLVRALPSKEWMNVRLTLDLKQRTVSGQVGAPGNMVTFDNKSFSSSWAGVIDYFAIEAPGGSDGRFPSLELDNVAVQQTPIPSIPTGIASKSSPTELAAITEQLEQLLGLDGDFEAQKRGTPPAKPWHPGPNSAAKISSDAQSPYRNFYGPGQLGIRLPNSGAYNGFGQTFTNPWKADSTERLFASFDFRCAHQDAGGTGSWRFYLGHNTQSAAVELGIHSTQFYRRAEDTHEAVAPLRLGQWYQVQLALNLKERTYTGSLATTNERITFDGRLAKRWDGHIDYTYIDSGGHLSGVKPALDADNFVVQETPVPPLAPGALNLTAADGEARSRKIAELQRRLVAVTAEMEKPKQELNAMLAQGPLDLAYGVVEGTPHNARLQMRGEPDRPGNEVPRGFLTILGGKDQKEPPQNLTGSGRLELAQWLTSPDNPLPARVLVNRLWQHHFGQGLVKTPNDFGARGQRPTHPELLEHLAASFIQNGWSIKAMHRLILSSAAYQQASPGDAAMTAPPGPGLGTPPDVANGAPNPPASAADTFSPFARRRLSAEELRDSILFVSGELDPVPGRGHPFPVPTSWNYSQHAPFSAVYDHNKRSVYLMTQRIKRHPFLALFDGPDPNASTPERRTTTVPTQALFFLNDPFVHAKAEKWAARLRRASSDPARCVELAYRQALGRSPSDAERADAAEFLAAYRAELGRAPQEQVETAALAAYARVLFGSNEFLNID